MDTLTRWISYISPGLAAKRLTAQAHLAAATRLYEAAQYSPYRPRKGGPESGDAVMDIARTRPREYARWLDENHDIAVAVLDDLVARVVGTGVGIEPTVQDVDGNLMPELNQKIKDLWCFFWESPEVTGEIPGPELERMICRTWLRDGEVFIQHVQKDSAPHNTDIPYSLEVLESDFVPFEMHDEKKGVVHGVQKNVWGVPTGYWCHKTHPGDATLSLYRGSGLFSDLKFIPAKNLTHLKLTKRLHQTRGISIFHSVFGRLADLKDYEESIRVSERIAAAFSAFIVKSADYGEYPIEPLTGQRSFEMSPGMIFDSLQPGEKVEALKSDRPGAAVDEFRNGQIRAVAGGTGTRYSSISRHYTGTYSSQRQELVEGEVHYRKLFNYLAYRFYLPVWRRFIDSAIFAGELIVPTFGIRIASLYYPELRAPATAWIDPLKEMLAYEKAIQIGVKSRYQVIRDTGGDPQAVDAQLAADTFRAVSTSAQPEPDPMIDMEEAA